jgi:hypothetical protein
MRSMNMAMYAYAAAALGLDYHVIGRVPMSQYWAPVRIPELQLRDQLLPLLLACTTQD